ncbi:hypothetical protein [Pararhizobium sp. A13]|uniref:hypothetical protein n=1 Tax=Pararhizobium sp. A13 TaxID=3133975 RepID=UPI00324DB164
MFVEWLGEEPTSLIVRLKSLTADLERLAANKRISFSREPILIDDWILSRRAVPCLLGRMTGHPTIADNNPGVTSEVYFLDENLGLARTLSRWYRLETPMVERART